MRFQRLLGLRAFCVRVPRTPVRCCSTSGTPTPQGPKIDPHEFTGHKAHHSPHEAYLFGRAPGAKQEGWEKITFFVWVGAAAVLCYGLITRSGDSMEDWAKREARAREQRLLEGKEIEYGKHYQNEGKFSHEEVDQMPTIAEDEE